MAKTKLQNVDIVSMNLKFIEFNDCVLVRNNYKYKPHLKLKLIKSLN